MVQNQQNYLIQMIYKFKPILKIIWVFLWFFSDAVRKLTLQFMMIYHCFIPYYNHYYSLSSSLSVWQLLDKHCRLGGLGTRRHNGRRIIYCIVALTVWWTQREWCRAHEVTGAKEEENYWEVLTHRKKSKSWVSLANQIFMFIIQL